MKQVFMTNPSTWWKRRSVLERGLTVILLLMALNFRSCDTSSTAETGSAGQEALSDSPKKDDNECKTPGCVHAASMVLKNMDRNVEPCDDFYNFACGGFIKSTVIPDDQVGVSAFTVTEEKLEKQLLMSINSKIEDNDPKHFRLVKNLYKSCMNTRMIEAEGLGPLKKILNKLGGWPVVNGDQWNDTDFDWIDSIYKFQNAALSINYFIDFGIGADLKNSTKNIIYLDQASLGLAREYLSKGFDEKLVQEYNSYMVDIAVIFGAKRERAIVELKESLLFEINLANISLPEEERHNITKLYNPMSISELRNKYPNICWRELFGRLLPSSISVDDNEIAIVIAPSYISQLEKLIAITPKKVQANYIMWRATMDLVRYLNDDVRKRELKYNAVLNGATKQESRWKECVGKVSQKLPLSVGAMYVRKYFTKEAKDNAEEMVMDIRKQFGIILSEIEWMDDKTRQIALEKAATMTSLIAYSNELLDDNKLEEFYAKLELSGGNYLESILNISLFEIENSYGTLRKPVNKNDWISKGNPAIVNAFYSMLENSITFPAGILQGVFFSNDRPKYMNYGAIGTIIGHELTHGFDDVGRQFDEDGNLVGWWAPSTEEKYLQRAQCIIDQYGNYTFEEVGLKLNGITTQSENIADNGAFKLAYYAYNNWADRNLPEGKLPGLSYTPRQMFWISAANVWCSISRRKEIETSITTDVHSPSEFRILGSLSNRPEFSEDFNCPIDSKMNPQNKCSVW